jgi:hypothetical protein
MNPTPEEQASLYEALDVKVQLTSEGTLIASGEVGLLLRQLTRVREDRELVPGHRRVGEDVGEDVTERSHPAE